jgi:ceramide glucosyltransferase
MRLLLQLWLWAAVAFTLLALARRLMRRATELLSIPERGLLLRPVDAPTAQEQKNLEAIPPGLEQWVLSPFRVSSEKSRWLPSDPIAANRKLGHLQYALSTLATAGGPVLLVDADVQVDEALVNDLLGALSPQVALAWAAPWPQETGVTRGLLVQSLHGFESLDALSSSPKPLCGKAMALSAEAVEALKEVPDCIGEDLELSALLSRKGLRAQLAGRALIPGAHTDPLSRFTRWMQVLKAHRPGLFPTVPLLFACTPTLGVLSLLDFGSTSLTLFAALVFLRACAAALGEGRLGIFGAWFVAEILLLASWLRALWSGSTIYWRGRKLTLKSGGLLHSEAASDSFPVVIP